MASVRRHFSPLTPFMELYNVIFLPSPYRRGETVAIFMEPIKVRTADLVGVELRTEKIKFN